MLIDLSPKRTELIYPTPILQQSDFWAKVKQKQGWHPKAFDIKLRTTTNYDHNTSKSMLKYDDILVINKKISSEFNIAYIPYGPKELPDENLQGNWLEELSESIRFFLPSNTIFIRYDLVWQSPWAKENEFYDHKGVWQGPPDTRIQEIRMNYGTHNHNLRKSPTNNLPSNTIFIDLEKNNDLLLRRMKPKTRYNIKISQRKGVEVHEVDESKLHIWYTLYKDTALRNGIQLHHIDFFKTILENKKNNARSSADISILLAENDGIPLAGMFLAIAGGRATYLYGASSCKNRNMMGTYALQWEAIQRGKRAGCFEYDMFGISERPDPAHPMYGLYKFKKGFGGNIYHRQGCWDYVLNEQIYENYRALELNQTGYHV